MKKMLTLKDNPLNKLDTNDLTNDILDLNIDEIDKINSLRDRRARRLQSTYITVRPKLFLEEKEDILISLSKKQHKLNDFSKNKESIIFSERQNVIQWCLQVLENIEIAEYQKTSIFHRFCTAFDYLMEKYFLLNKIINEQEELKIMVITIFLLAYKMEGLILAKLTISSLIDSFMKENKADKNELIDIVARNEMNIISILDFNPQIFNDNNIHQISYILFDLFAKKYILKFSEKEERKIHKALDFINKSIEFSDKILFKYYPIDKAMLSFYSAVEYSCIKRQSILDALKKYNRYLRNNIQIIKLTKEDFDKYCVRFAKIMYKNKI